MPITSYITFTIKSSCITHHNEEMHAALMQLYPIMLIMCCTLYRAHCVYCWLLASHVGPCQAPLPHHVIAAYDSHRVMGKLIVTLSHHRVDHHISP